MEINYNVADCHEIANVFRNKQEWKPSYKRNRFRISFYAIPSSVPFYYSLNLENNRWDDWGLRVALTFKHPKVIVVKVKADFKGPY